MNFWNSLSGGNAAGTEDSGASGWLSSLREKGKEIAEVYKRDLAEFTSVVKKDTAVVAEEVLSKTKATVEQNFNKLPQAAPHAVSSYTSDPEHAEYAEFRAAFSAERKTAEIAELLDAVPRMQAIHQELVPEKVAYTDFWSRYFFLAQQAAAEEERKHKLLTTSQLFDDDDEFAWDEDDSPAPADMPAHFPLLEGQRVAAAVDTVAREGETKEDSVARDANRPPTRPRPQAPASVQEAQACEADGRGAQSAEDVASRVDADQSNEIAEGVDNLALKVGADEQAAKGALEGDEGASAPETTEDCVGGGGSNGGAEVEAKRGEEAMGVLSASDSSGQSSVVVAAVVEGASEGTSRVEEEGSKETKAAAGAAAQSSADDDWGDWE